MADQPQRHPQTGQFVAPTGMTQYTGKQIRNGATGSTSVPAPADNPSVSDAALAEIRATKAGQAAAQQKILSRPRQADIGSAP